MATLMHAQKKSSNSLQEDSNSEIAATKQALNQAKQKGDNKQIIISLTHLGALYSKTSNYKDAEATLKDAIKSGVAEELSALLTDAYLELGIVYLRQQKLDSARNVLGQGIVTAKAQNEALKLGLLYNMLGNVEKEENNFTVAVENYIKATAIFEQYKSNDELTQSLSNLGNILNILGNTDKAEAYALKALEIAEKANKDASVAYANRLLGRIYRKQKRFDEALKRYATASGLYQKLGEKREFGETYTNVGNIYFELGKYNRALDYYFDALRIKRTIPDSVGIAYDFTAAAITFYNLKKLELALVYIDSGMFFAKKKNVQALVMDGYQNKSDIYSELKQYRQAHENYIRYVAMKDSLDILHNKEAADKLEAKYQSQKKENEISNLHADNEIKSLQLEKQRTQRIYLIGISLLAFLLIALLYNRYRIKQRSAEKLKQLDAVKSSFFANISHEFRTPLSLILSPLQKSLSEPDSNLSRSDIDMMYRNATRLHGLINQLLDLSRLESGKMRLHLEETDLRRFIATLCSAFQSQADQRQMEYHIMFDDGNGAGVVDRDKIEKIIYNLLSNAFKFTPDGGRVDVEVRKPSDLVIRIRDNGIGISSAHIPFVFDRFYQVDTSSTRFREGTGIGLALAKELAETHKGSLQVISTEGKGSEFILAVPVDREHYHADDFTQASGKKDMVDPRYRESVKSAEEKLTETENEELPILLIAEDNADMRSFIRDTLKRDYRIVEAEDGLHAWELAQAFLPDLIISDIMMPRMDGTTLCEKIKSTFTTSHIPVVMLTARAGQQSKIEGLQRGADDYLVKPFDLQELKVRVQNLIVQRKKLRDLYRQEIMLQPNDVVVTSLDAEFLQKALSVLEKSCSNSEFGVDEFNREIGFSRMQLHRKLKALTGQSTGEFIKQFRLEKAKQLLSVKGAQVSQVAYDCGFNNVSHFSKSFKDYAGMTPSQFADKVLQP
ncbi:Signal transduction histidine kinase [Ohtaekwangia koreensis]|uniref:histidine kinase n=2 Tax=Ohtaekwangia koreensis TaxID=688867 RepID=A0A1T5M506_9BACT|nr:Signal transduction histidine kinase [Ohtaekwangia koreensis]